METVFGLDFGTTNSALSVRLGEKVEIIDIDAHNIVGKTLRSVLYFNEDGGIFVGQEAIERYIEECATGRFMQSIKSFLSSRLFDHTRIYRKKYRLEDLVAIILKTIKQRGENYVGHEVDAVVIGRPVIFSDDQEEDKLAEDRLRTAAQKIGFRNIYFQFEPVAAALTFEQTLQAGKEKIVLIGDFGGGTSDFTVIKLRGNLSNKGLNRKDDILALGGVYVGGDIFDSQMMWGKAAKYFGKDIKYESMPGKWMEMPREISCKLRQWHLIPQLREKMTRDFIRRVKQYSNDPKLVENLENLIDDNYGFMLFQSIEKAKIELSYYEKSQIIFQEQDLLIKEDIIRIEFEEMIKEDVGKIRKCLEKTVLSAGLTDADIDQVFITGGSSFIPCIKQLFVDKFGEGKIKQMDAFTSIAYGLGVSADLF